jgi:hypothetical protein
MLLSETLAGKVFKLHVFLPSVSSRENINFGKKDSVLETAIIEVKTKLIFAFCNIYNKKSLPL